MQGRYPRVGEAHGEGGASLRKGSSSAGPLASPGRSTAVFVPLTRDECTPETQRSPEFFEISKTRWCGGCTNVATSRPVIGGLIIDHTTVLRFRERREDQTMPVTMEDGEDIFNVNGWEDISIDITLDSGT